MVFAHQTRQCEEKSSGSCFVNEPTSTGTAPANRQMQSSSSGMNLPFVPSKTVQHRNTRARQNDRITAAVTTVRAVAALDREAQRQLPAQRNASESTRPQDRDTIAPWSYEPPLSPDVENFFTPASTTIGEPGNDEAEQFFVQDPASNEAVRTIPRQEQKGKAHLGDLSAESGLRPPSPSPLGDPSEWGGVSDSTLSSMKSWDKASAII